MLEYMSVGSWSPLALWSGAALFMLQGASALPFPLHLNESALCEGGRCSDPSLPYQQIANVQPGYQWNDAGGYCGSWSIQRATLALGGWISQQQVRDHTSPGGGHDNEILSTNIDEAYRNLKLSAEGFNFTTTPLPQIPAYTKWLKKQLVEGYVVTWMILWSGQDYPIYGLTPPAGMYGHVEPVIGIESSHPLNDTTVYDDDTVVHLTDGGVNKVYRTLSSLSGSWAGPGKPAKCGAYSYCQGPYAFGWAVKGFADHTKQGMPAYLHIQPYLSEPDIRAGASPDKIQGTLFVSGLTVGASYDIYRWDSLDDAFTYSDTFKKTSFQASDATFVYKDDTTFLSNGITYYRCVPS